MADISDVVNAIAQLCEDAIYPNGSSSPSVAGVDVNIITGWPLNENLLRRMEAGKATVSVFPTNQERNITKLQRIPFFVSQQDSTTTATVSLNTVTLGGTVDVGKAVVVILNKVAYGHLIETGDTLGSIASSLAADIPGATALGAVITITGVIELDAKTTSIVTSGTEVGRQERVVSIMIWAPTPEIRIALGSAITVFFQEKIRIDVGDISANIVYKNSREDDSVQEGRVYRRDVNYTINYPTILYSYAPTVTWPHANLEINNHISGG